LSWNLLDYPVAHVAPLRTNKVGPAVLPAIRDVRDPGSTMTTSGLRAGYSVLALVRGSDVTLKKFYRDPGNKIRLQPANAAMQPIFVDPDQVQIQGVVVGVMRKY